MKTLSNLLKYSEMARLEIAVQARLAKHFEIFYQKSVVLALEVFKFGLPIK
jgi:hypothetical protein